MARPTRQQRRERRAQQPEPALAGGPPSAPPRRPTAAAGGEPHPHREPHAERRRVPVVGFIRESWGELKKVEWPSQKQVIAGTTVVLIACVVVGTYLYVNDIVWKHVVQNFLIK